MNIAMEKFNTILYSNFKYVGKGNTWLMDEKIEPIS